PAPKQSLRPRTVVIRPGRIDRRLQCWRLRPWTETASHESGGTPRKLPARFAGNPDFPGCVHRNCADATRGGKCHVAPPLRGFRRRCGGDEWIQGFCAVSNTAAGTCLSGHRKARSAEEFLPRVRPLIQRVKRSGPEGAAREQ